MSTAIPKITVLIPTYKRPKYLFESLQSIFSQTLPAYQIIVINNGSNPETRDFCKSLLDKIDYYEYDILGKSNAINHGLQFVKGDYLWIFDDDDVALPDALERFVQPLLASSKFGFSYSTFFYSKKNEDDQIWNINRETKIPNFEDTSFLIELLKNDFIGGGSFFVRTSCYGDVGKYHPELLRSQDYDMILRLALRFKGTRVEGATFHSREHSGDRGSGSGTFSAVDSKKQWLKYDQIIFSDIYIKVSLEEYLPNKEVLDLHRRRAILQRMAIMSNKLLFAEVFADLEELSKLKDVTPVSKQEYSIIREMITDRPYYNQGSLYDNMDFFRKICNLSVHSPTMRLLRSKICYAVLARFKSRPELSRIPEVLLRISSLYL